MANIMVIYYSRTGNTRKMAELVAEGAGQDGLHKVQLVPAQDVDSVDLVAVDGFAFGSPDYYGYMAGHLKVVFDGILRNKPQLKNKPFVAFVNHGGGGGAIKSLEGLAQAGSIGLRKIAEGLACKGAPQGADAEACRQLGRALAKAVS